jgi:hypothetical protein
LADRRPPVHYTVRLTHHWDGRIEVFVEDVSDDARSRASVGHALARAAEAFGSLARPEAAALHRLALERINALMGAEAGTDEARELEALAEAVQAYEVKAFPD